jgi:threonine synthase
VTRIRGLTCRECKRSYPLAPTHVCEFCFGPLEVEYDYDLIRTTISRERIAAGPLSLWRYRDLLPIEQGEDTSWRVGFTPLQRADNLARVLGLRELYVKNDSVNPTFSFKDRVVAVAIAKAKEFGFDTIACASTGNLAAAVAAAGAKAGLRTFVFVPADIEQSKILNAAVYGAQIVAVRGTYDELNRLCSEIADRERWAFFNINLRAFYSEGSKSLAFETAEQLGWRLPDHVVVPIASGSLLVKITKGFGELQKVGLVAEKRVRISGAQPAGCGPVAEAFAAGTMNVRPVRRPNTIAKSLAIGNPADGYYVLQAVKRSDGAIEAVSEEEIVDGMRLLAQTEGIFTETAGGVTVATLKRLVERGVIRPDEVTVAYITGNGLKTQEALAGHLGEPLHIDPTLDSFHEALAKHTPAYA